MNQFIISKDNKNQNHCSCCRYNLSNAQPSEEPTQVEIISLNSSLNSDEAFCEKCNFKRDKFFMDEHRSGFFICSQHSFCQQRIEEQAKMVVSL